MFGKHLLACAIILAVPHTIRAEYDVDAFCTLVKDGLKLSSIDSCQTYYECRGGKGIIHSCLSSMSFDKNSQTCRPASDVNCYYGVNQPCAGKHNVHVPIDGTCGDWVYCQNGVEIGRGQCANGQIFSNGGCNYGNCNKNNLYDDPHRGFKSACNVIPNNVYFGSNMDCAKWQICQNEKLKTGDCSEKYVFDVQIGKCNYNNQALCARVNGKDIQPDDDGPCTKEGQEKASGSTCSNYLICRNGNWIRYRCQAGQFYDIKYKTCRSRLSAIPSEYCDRCEGSKKQFVNAVDRQCRKYYTCQNGFRTGNSTCQNLNSYFSEKDQLCITDLIPVKESYQSVNGACAFEPSGNNGGNTGGSSNDTGEGGVQVLIQMENEDD